MGLWSRLFRRKQLTAGPIGAGIVAGVSSTGRPPPRGTTEMLAAYSNLPRLRAVVDRIASSVASTAWTLSRRDRVIDQHPALLLLAAPNPMLTGRQFFHIVQTYMDLVGETFVVVERNQSGRPLELWPLPPSWVRQLPKPEDPNYSIAFRGGAPKRVPEGDVIWMRTPDPINPYSRGTGLGASLNNELDADEYAAQTTSNMFFNNATPELLVSLKGADEASGRAFKEKWLKQSRGFRNAKLPHITSAEIDVKQLSSSFVDMDLVNLRKFESDIIRETFGVPPEVLGNIVNNNRATIQSAQFLFATNVLVPRLSVLRDHLNARLLPMFGASDLAFDFESPIPEDEDFKLEVIKSAPWAFSIDEIREMAGLSPKDRGGDQHLVPQNLLPETPGNSTRDAAKAVSDIETPKIETETTESEQDSDLRLVVDGSQG